MNDTLGEKLIIFHRVKQRILREGGDNSRTFLCEILFDQLSEKQMSLKKKNIPLIVGYLMHTKEMTL